ncbi:hypothetical protein T07_2654 [Trichinella nelsoni]|uniref:Uncharacterized protein n=1 Tax=Trichinella nelsoni TaxID=6336 RepID=A0A0V0RC78_9BILA|nr:hypothetical protein T07_2654 [Trichinella nelsoni]
MVCNTFQSCKALLIIAFKSVTTNISYWSLCSVFPAVAITIFAAFYLCFSAIMSGSGSFVCMEYLLTRQSIVNHCIFFPTKNMISRSVSTMLTALPSSVLLPGCPIIPLKRMVIVLFQ